MKRILPLGILSTALCFVAFANPLLAQRSLPPTSQFPRSSFGPPQQRYDPAADLEGMWYMHGNPRLPCEIGFNRRGEMLLTNENGETAVGVLDGDRVWIPAWNDGMGSRGLVGRIRGNRIVWPNGSYWSR